MNSEAINIVFMGSPQYAVTALEWLITAGQRVTCVVTQPDRARGRGGRVLPTPVGTYAEGMGLPVLKPERLKGNQDFIQALEKAAPDLIVVAAYGKILPKPLLELPPLGCVNIHASLLPEYRGAAPVQRAILDGKRETGVTLMYMSEGLDTGDMIACVKAAADDANAGELTDRLARIGAKLLTDMLPEIAEGTAPRIPQDDTKATYAEKISKAEGHIDLHGSADEAARKVRAMTPSPGAYVLAGGERIVITEAIAAGPEECPAGAYRDGHCVAVDGKTAAPGTVVAVPGGDGIHVCMGEGILLIKALKAPGRKAMPVSEYLKGNAFDAAVPLA